MVGWHHPLNGPEFEQGLGENGRQGSQACCTPWGHTDSDTTYDRTEAHVVLRPLPQALGLVLSHICPMTLEDEELLRL